MSTASEGDGAMCVTAVDLDGDGVQDLVACKKHLTTVNVGGRGPVMIKSFARESYCFIQGTFSSDATGVGTCGCFAGYSEIPHCGPPQKQEAQEAQILEWANRAFRLRLGCVWAAFS